MASIVPLLSELLGGESASVLAAERYMCGHSSRLLLGEFRPAVTDSPAAAANKLGQRPPVEDQRASAGTEWVRDGRKKTKEEASFEDLAVSRIAVDGIMWP